DHVSACAYICVVADASSPGDPSARSDVAERADGSVVCDEGSDIHRDVAAEIGGTAYNCVWSDDAAFAKCCTRREFRRWVDEGRSANVALCESTGDAGFAVGGADRDDTACLRVLVKPGFVPEHAIAVELTVPFRTIRIEQADNSVGEAGGDGIFEP